MIFELLHDMATNNNKREIEKERGHIKYENRIHFSNFYTREMKIFTRTKTDKSNAVTRK